MHDNTDKTELLGLFHKYLLDNLMNYSACQDMGSPCSHGFYRMVIKIDIHSNER